MVDRRKIHYSTYSNHQEGSREVSGVTLHCILSFSFSSDQSDVDLCHSLANLIAVILGCQPQSNHLWYNLLAADQLTGTYMPGFMVRGSV